MLEDTELRKVLYFHDDVNITMHDFKAISSFYRGRIEFAEVTADLAELIEKYIFRFFLKIEAKIV